MTGGEGEEWLVVRERSGWWGGRGVAGGEGEEWRVRERSDWW